MKKIKYVLGNESGSLMLEQVVLISIFLLISLGLLILLFKMDDMNKTKAAYSVTTGWFRTTDITGIKTD